MKLRMPDSAILRDCLSRSAERFAEAAGRSFRNAVSASGRLAFPSVRRVNDPRGKFAAGPVAGCLSAPPRPVDRRSIRREKGECVRRMRKMLCLYLRGGMERNEKGAPIGLYIQASAERLRLFDHRKEDASG